MNIYDTKVIVCISCKKAIGEIESESTVNSPLCGRCALIEDKICCNVKYNQSNPRIKIRQIV